MLILKQNARMAYKNNFPACLLAPMRYYIGAMRINRLSYLVALAATFGFALSVAIAWGIG